MRALETLSGEAEAELSELENERRSLLKRLENADRRFVAAKAILATPIDDLRTDVLLAEEAEQRLAQVSERLNRKSAVTVDVSAIDAMERENQRRRREIERLRSHIELSRSQIPLATERYETQRPKARKVVPVKTPARFAQSEIDAMFARLDRRRVNIEDENSAIDEFEASNQRIREQYQSEFEEKVRRIEALGETLRCLQNTNVQLDEAGSIVREFANAYEEMRGKKEKVIRWQKLIQEARERMEAKTSDLEAKAAGLEEKKRRIVRQQTCVKELLDEVAALEDEVSKMERRLPEADDS